MSLAEDDLDQIRRLIREEVESRLSSGVVRYDLELRERMVRVEEELKHQRELMERGFELMEKRFEQVDRRFEQVDHRFEQLTTRIDRFMKWSFATTFAVGGLVVAAIRYL